MILYNPDIFIFFQKMNSTFTKNTCLNMWLHICIIIIIQLCKLYIIHVCTYIIIIHKMSCGPIMTIKATQHCQCGPLEVQSNSISALTWETCQYHRHSLISLSSPHQANMGLIAVMVWIGSRTHVWEQSRP